MTEMMGVRLPVEMKNIIEAEAAEKQTSLSSVIHEKIKKGFEQESIDLKITSLEANLAEIKQTISAGNEKMDNVLRNVMENKKYTVFVLCLVAELLKDDAFTGARFMQIAKAAEENLAVYLRTGKLTQL